MDQYTNIFTKYDDESKPKNFHGITMELTNNDMSIMKQINNELLNIKQIEENKYIIKNIDNKHTSSIDDESIIYRTDSQTTNKQSVNINPQIIDKQSVNIDFKNNNKVNEETKTDTIKLYDELIFYNVSQKELYDKLDEYKKKIVELQRMNIAYQHIIQEVNNERDKIKIINNELIYKNELLEDDLNIVNNRFSRTREICDKLVVVLHDGCNPTRKSEKQKKDSIN
jgi:hypothetical protein